MRRISKTKNVTKIFTAATIVVAIIFGISSYFLSKTTDIVVAQVNGQNIYKLDVERKLRNIFAAQSFGSNSQEMNVPALSDLPKEVVEILIKEVYLSTELVKKAKEHKIDQTQATQELINNILRQQYVNHLVKTEVTQEALQNKYVEISNELAGKKEYLIYHIVVKTEKEAKKIRRKMKGTPTFEELAKKYSLDTNSAKDGGKLGFVIEENMLKEIAETITSMKKGKVSSPIQTKFGWHIVKFSEIRDAKAPDFENIKDTIREELSREIANNVNSELLKDAKINILITLKSHEAEAVIEEDKTDSKTK